MSLQGIPDIRKVFIREAKRILPSADAPDGYSNDSEWMLDTEGVNLLQVPACSPSPCCPPALCSPCCVVSVPVHVHNYPFALEQRVALVSSTGLLCKPFWVGTPARGAWREGLHPAHYRCTITRLLVLY